MNACVAVIQAFYNGLARTPYSLLALLARLSLAAVFWMSGQTKVEGFVVDIIEWQVQLGWPRLSDSAVSLFQDEYKLPLLAPQVAAVMAATAEHLLPLMLVLGLGTRFAAMGLAVMTAVIQLFVYPSAFATHGTWLALCGLLMVQGPGRLALDAFFVKPINPS